MNINMHDLDLPERHSEENISGAVCDELKSGTLNGLLERASFLKAGQII